MCQCTICVFVYCCVSWGQRFVYVFKVRVINIMVKQPRISAISIQLRTYFLTKRLFMYVADLRADLNSKDLLINKKNNPVVIYLFLRTCTTYVGR